VPAAVTEPAAAAGPRTLILQSHSWQVLRGWIGTCVDSVRSWSEAREYDYRFLGDEIFELVPEWYKAKTDGRLPIQADLARLLLLRDALDQGYERALWFDADCLVFAPEALDIDAVTDSCAFGRELWVAPDAKGRLKTWRSLHNAACLFRRGDPVLPFLIRATERVVAKADPSHIAPQMVGPKLLTALDAMGGFGRMDRVAGFSPAVLDDLAAGEGPALTVLRAALAKDGMPTPAAANLCASLCEGPEAEARMEAAIGRLLAGGAFPLHAPHPPGHG
jgi:hypothetical protein